jgi:hypothetical protein
MAGVGAFGPGPFGQRVKGRSSGGKWLDIIAITCAVTLGAIVVAALPEGSMKTSDLPLSVAMSGHWGHKKD